MYSLTLLPLVLLSTLATAIPTSSPSADNKPQGASKNSTVNGTANNRNLIRELLLAPTAVEKLALIPSASDWVYDFHAPPPGATTAGKGGMTVKADRLAFPPLVGNGVSMTLGFIGPCGFNTPHIHPRSAEINIVVRGRLGTEFSAENGAKNIINELEEFQMTVFPQGAVHTEFNPDCTPATFVAAFADEDPGVQQSAQTLFGLQKKLVKAVLGNKEVIEGIDLDRFRDMIPDNVALGVESCLKKCGLQKRK